MTFLVIMYCVVSLCNYALAPLPLSHRALELTSAKTHIVECHSGKIRAGGAALRCTPPYFDHCEYGQSVQFAFPTVPSAIKNGVHSGTTLGIISKIITGITSHSQQLPDVHAGWFRPAPVAVF